jgi:outer membrane receptor protein involved in Fe transport
MRLDRNELSKAVRMALSLGAVAAVGAVGTAQAQDQTTSQGQTNQPQTLQTIVVTGSNIRRVDLETSNPVVTVDRAQIQSSGKVTLGDLIQELPSMTGSPQNARVNNGGGSGSAAANLRGLGTARTLVLVNGHRVINGDLNIIPAELVERVEVLNDGASATYGSDAIGGVVNFILRSNYQGAQFTADYGISDHDDGVRKGASFIFGQTSDKGSIIAGVDYNKQEGISSANRDFSKDALYHYYGYVFPTGSSRNPFGRAILKSTANVFDPTDPTGPGIPTEFDANNPDDCSSATRKGPTSNANGGPGTGQSLTDYRCYSGATDAYNFQLLNFDEVPQERVNAFLSGTYQLTDNVQAYLSVFHNHTTSESAIAPLPFDADSDGVTISRYSMYNPFGVDFGPPQNNATYLAASPTGVPSTAQPDFNFLTRWTGMGQRKGEFSQTTDDAILGLKGNIGQSSWQWDANFNFGWFSRQVHTVGDLVYNQDFRNALGPSMVDNDPTSATFGQPICVSTPGVASTKIANCTPLNIFDQDSAASEDIERKFLATLFSNLHTQQRVFNVSANGNVFSLPAGDAQLAVGADYRKLYLNNQVDFLALTDTNPNDANFSKCQVPQSACGSPTRGGYNVKEAYGELFVPIIKDVPFIKALNVTLGGRYSKYSLAGSTTNYKLAVEWRPIDDLLLRGTVQDVFRAPTIGDLFGGPGGSAPPFTDPCIGLTASELATHSNACQNVGPGATKETLQNGLSQTTAVVSGSTFAGVNLKPEFGRSFDFGFVYDPHFIPGLSVNVDLWRIYLNNAITTVDAQTITNICFNDNTSSFCDLIHRKSNGQISQVNEPTVNLGRFDTRGVDLGVSYRVPQVSWLPGQFTLVANATYLGQYDNNSGPGIAGAETFHLAGHFYKGFGSFPRVRGQVGLNWKDGAWDAAWRTQYIGKETIGSADPNQQESADGALAAYTIAVPTIIYNNLEVGYNIEPINTQISLGVDNVFDKQPPIFTQTSVVNANTDVNTYDTVGRFYWARATVKF